MHRKDNIHKYLNDAAMELLEFIKESESEFRELDRWVPAAKIKSDLELNLVAVPKSGKQYGERGWLFATLARILEDRTLVEYKKLDNRAYYRSAQDGESDR